MHNEPAPLRVQTSGRRHHLYCLFLVLIFDCTSVFGQNPQPPLEEKPTAPFVAEPPKSSTFSVAISYSDIPAPAPGGQGAKAEPAPIPERPTSVTVWKDAATQRTVVKYASGASAEGYLFDSGFAIRSTRGAKETFVTTTGKGAAASLEVFANDYPGTQWIGLSYFKGIEQRDGEPVFVYEKPAKVLTSSSDGPPPDFRPFDAISAVGYIRVKDKTPVAVILGPATYTFSQTQPWTETLTLPKNFRSTADDYKKGLSILEALKQKKKNPSNH